jgi:hypothetical protein
VPWAAAAGADAWRSEVGDEARFSLSTGLTIADDEHIALLGWVSP